MQTRIAYVVAAAMLAFASGAGATDYAFQNLTAQYGGDFNWRLINNSGELAGFGEKTLHLQLTSGRATYQLGNDVYRVEPTVLANDGSAYFRSSTYDGFHWDSGISRNGNAIPIPSLPNSTSGNAGSVSAINDRGVAVGSGAGPGGELRATIYKDGQAIDISGGLGQGTSYATSINNQGVVAGTFRSNDNFLPEGFVYVDGQVTRTGRNSWTERINDQKLVAGERITSDDAGLYTSIFLYQDGVRTDVSLSGLRDTEVVDLNNANQLLGKAYDTSSDATYFLYVNGETIMLDDLLAIHGYAGWKVGAAYDINDKGQILLDAYHYAGSEYVERSLLLSPVPEPGTWAMLLAGLGGIGVLKRRRAAAA